MATHTAGPWVVSDSRGSLTQDIVTARNARDVIATAWARVEQEANARLIAAAPELLAAAQMIIETCPCDNDITLEFDTAWRLLKQAIQSASGSPEDAK